MARGHRPNIIVILTDDQGWGDLGCQGASDLRTPHLDALAASGARCTNWYSNAPVCSPARAALLTGRYPGNAGVRSILAGHRTAKGLPPEVPTLASALGDLGYNTAMFGKWHLGLAQGSRPQDHGFARWFGFMAGCIDYYSHIFYWGMSERSAQIHDLWEDGREVYENGAYFTDLVTQRALEFLATTDDRPFFLYLPYNAPHYPLHAPAHYLERFPHLPWPRQIMAAMLAAVDDGVGRVRAALDRHGLTQDTIVCFTSDNGPSREMRNWMDGQNTPFAGGQAGPLKGHKFSLFEGGIRVPGIVSWPGRIPAGQVLDGMAASMDLFPTLLRAAGGDPDAYELDGLDLGPMLWAGAPSPHRALFWENGRQTAVRQGRWKLVLDGQLVEGVAPEDAVHLADVVADPGERRNLQADLPELTAALTGEARRWREGIERRWQEQWLPRQTGTTGRPTA